MNDIVTSNNLTQKCHPPKLNSTSVNVTEAPQFMWGEWSACLYSWNLY